MGERQERNFHLNYEGTTLFRTCDVDWAVLVPNVSGNVTIRTAPLLGRTNCNTRLTLFNAAIAQLAQNDNISPSNLYSSLTFNVTANIQYFIRIENLTANTNGYYALFVSCPGGQDPSLLGISGPDRFCSWGSYSVSGLAAGTAVTWTVSPASMATVQGQGNSSVTLNKTTTTTGTLTASFTNSCNITMTLTKNVSTGGYNSGDYPVSGPSSASCGQQVFYQTVHLPDATNYQWVNIPPGATNVSGLGTRFLSFTVPSGIFSMSVGVRVASSCDAGGSPAIQFTSVSCMSGFRLVVFPNLSDGGEVTVSLLPEQSPGVSQAQGAQVAQESDTAQAVALVKRFDSALVEILDADGQVRRTGRIKDGKWKVNLRGLPRSMYYVRATTGDRRVTVQLYVQP